jgi:hypothetical protein
MEKTSSSSILLTIIEQWEASRKWNPKVSAPIPTGDVQANALKRAKQTGKIVRQKVMGMKTVAIPIPKVFLA